MNRRSGAALAAFALAATAGCAGDRGDPNAPRIITTDLHQFVAAYAAFDRSDSSCAALAPVFAQATAGLKKYDSKFDAGLKDLCAAVRRHPEWYDSLRDKLPRLDAMGDSARAAFLRFKQLYPDARFVPVYFVPGNGIAAGTTTMGPSPIILIGAERLGSLEGLPHMLVHELVHVQQSYPWRGMMTGGPKFLRGTVLRHSIKEGSADFLADLVAGVPPVSRRRDWADAHEREMWTAFQQDKHSRDYGRWLYNGWNRAALGEWPNDLGYEMGYRITRAYYEKATDKAAAIREILHIRDFDQFLAASGYNGPRH